MPRTRTVPDAEILNLVCAQLAQTGEKSVTFASISAQTGLAAPTLVQRFGTRDAMQSAALGFAWDRLDRITAEVEAEALTSVKGATAMLKALSDAPETQLLTLSLRDEPLRARAELWRSTVETALAKRLGHGAKGQDLAAIVFAAWQGRLLWGPTGGKSFRLSDLLRRLA